MTMNTINDNPGLLLLREKIRHGKEPDNPALLPLWLSLEEEHQQHLSTMYLLAQHFENQFYLLLETVVDELVPCHWRRTCLDFIYKPLSSLQRISHDQKSKNHVAKLLRELAVSSRYVERSLIQ